MCLLCKLQRGEREKEQREREREGVHRIERERDCRFKEPMTCIEGER